MAVMDGEGSVTWITVEYDAGTVSGRPGARAGRSGIRWTAARRSPRRRGRRCGNGTIPKGCA